MNVLVTGSSGLVGSALIPVMEQKGYTCIALTSNTCNLTDYAQVLSFFTRSKPDIVVHLAARVGGLFKNMSDKVRMFEDNILINTHVVKASHECGVRTLVACLSTCVFPDGAVPLTESMLHEGPPHPSNEGYAYAKRMMEVQCRLYSENYPDRRYVCVIPTNVYGPHDNFHLEDSHVVPGLVHRCHLAKQNGVPFEVRGSGNPLRQFIFNGDLAKLIVHVLESGTRKSTVLCDSNEYSIREVAEMINSHFGNKLVFNEQYSDGQYRKTADNSNMKRLVPDFEFTDLRDGIKQTVHWFLNNYGMSMTTSPSSIVRAGRVGT